METGTGDIDALIKEQKRLLANEQQEEAWADARSVGIEAEIVAEAAIETAFIELVAEHGETAALALLDNTREKVLAGAFLRDVSRH